MNIIRIALCLLIVSASACSVKKAPDPIPATTESFAIPVTPEVIEGIIPSGDTPDSPEEKPVDLVIEVPPSPTTTHILVKSKPTSFLKKQLTNSPRNEVKSDNKNVTAEQPKQAVWWKWVVVVFLGIVFLVAFVLAFVLAVAYRIASISPTDIFRGLFKR